MKRLWYMVFNKKKELLEQILFESSTKRAMWKLAFRIASK